MTVTNLILSLFILGTMLMLIRSINQLRSVVISLFRLSHSQPHELENQDLSDDEWYYSVINSLSKEE